MLKPETGLPVTFPLYTDGWTDKTTAFGACAVSGDKVRALTSCTTCKDYITDSLANSEGVDLPEFPSTSPPYYLGDWGGDKFVLYVTMPQTFEENVVHFQEYEVEQGLTPVEVHAIEGCPNVYVLVADAWWKTTTLHASVFLSMIRNLRANQKLSSLEEARGDNYAWMVLPNIKKLVSALKHIKYIRRRNAPDKATQHNLNGHFSFLTTSPSLRSRLTYGDQLIGIDPSLPIPRNEVGTLIYPVKPIEAA